MTGSVLDSGSTKSEGHSAAGFAGFQFWRKLGLTTPYFAYYLGNGFFGLDRYSGCFAYGAGGLGKMALLNEWA